jgi:hypothetical protein
MAKIAHTSILSSPRIVTATSKGTLMDMTTLLIFVMLVLLLGVRRWRLTGRCCVSFAPVSPLRM